MWSQEGGDPAALRALRAARADPQRAPDEPHRFAFRPFHAAPPHHPPRPHLSLLLQRELVTVGEAAAAVARAWGLAQQPPAAGGGAWAIAGASANLPAAPAARPPPPTLVLNGVALRDPDALLWDCGGRAPGAIIYVL